MAALATIGLTGAALNVLPANGATSTDSVGQLGLTVAPLAPPLAAAFNSLTAPESSTGSRAALLAIKRSASPLPEGSMAANIDWGRAVGRPLDGGGSAWLAPSGQNVCLIVADPGGAVGGITCNTLAEAQRGDAVNVRQVGGMKSDQVLVVAAVPTGAPLPAAVSNGRRQAIPAMQNLAVGVLTTDQELAYDDQVVSLGDYTPASVTAAPQAP